jgi:hypothetical protein
MKKYVVKNKDGKYLTMLGFGNWSLVASKDMSYTFDNEKQAEMAMKDAKSHKLKDEELMVSVMEGLRYVKTYESFLNESNKTYKVEDFPEGTIVGFNDGEEFIVVKSGMRHPSDRKKEDEITMRPHNDLAKKRNVNMASDFSMGYLEKNVKDIKKP